jgi:hypothetical protein
MPSPVIIAVVAFVCCIVLAVGIYFATKKEDAGSSTGSGSPGPAVLTPKQTLLASGQAIQVAEQTISVAAPPTITTQPTGITATGSFTLSIDINMAARLPTGLLRVIGQGVHPGNPGLWLFPADSGDVWIRFHVGNSALDLVTGTAPPVYNTYYNITAVYDAPTHTATLYYNGVSKSSSTAIVPAGYVPPTPTDFGWNQQKLTTPTVKVKNTYWFNKALTAAEVATLTATSSGTTSTYMPEPIGYDKSESAN